MHCLVVLILVSCALGVFGEDCPEGTCQPEETCCPTAVPGDYTCCPFKDAVCCVDGIHCCPGDAECGVAEGTCQPKRCDRNLHTPDKLEKRQGDSESAHSDTCEPGTCLSDETCCPTGTPGDYSCCPYTNAVCCAGHSLCCPKDTECDIAKGMCVSNDVGNTLEKRQGLHHEDGKPKMQCGDGTLCPFGNTCCPIAGGKYGCCPHSHATCCPDMIHCCPYDQKCDASSHYCVGKRVLGDSAMKENHQPTDYEESA